GEVRSLLARREERQGRLRQERIRQQPRELPPAEIADEPLHRNLKEQRKLLHSLVGLYARRAGEPHGKVHTELRRICGGPAVAQASVLQLQRRINVLRNRLKD